MSENPEQQACPHGAIAAHPSSDRANPGYAACQICGARLTDNRALREQVKQLERELEEWKVAAHNAADESGEYAHKVVVTEAALTAANTKYMNLVEQVSRLVPVFSGGDQLTNEQLIDRAIAANQQIAGYQRECNEVEQVLGKALGYPWYKDDPKNFPDATEADGVCVGDHVPGSIAAEAADRLTAANQRAAAGPASYEISAWCVEYDALIQEQG